MPARRGGVGGAHRVGEFGQPGDDLRVLGGQQDQVRGTIGPADSVDLVQTQMLTQGIEVDLPKAAAEPIQDVPNTPPLVLSVDKEGNLYINVGDDEDEPTSGEEVIRRVGIVLRSRNAKSLDRLLPGSASFGCHSCAMYGPTSPRTFQAHGDDLFAATFDGTTADEIIVLSEFRITHPLKIVGVIGNQTFRRATNLLEKRTAFLDDIFNFPFP